MEKEPFDIHPSPELFYKSDAHQNGWGYLYQGIKSEEPILLVTGEYGTGKTLLCLRLVKLLKALKKKKNLPSVYLSTPTYDFKRVLEKIAAELNIFKDPPGTHKEALLQQCIYDYFENATDEKREKCIYLVIDDAQDFNYSFVNKLRLLCSYNVAGDFPIRLILFAHHDFFEILNDKKNAAMAGRIKRIYRLSPFDFEDTREYIYFRLTYSGASGAPVFHDDAIELIQGATRGIPRLINNICDNCLLVAGNERVNEINEDMVRQAMEMGNMVGLGSVYTAGEKKDSAARDVDATPARPPVQEVPASNPLPEYPDERPDIGAGNDLFSGAHGEPGPSHREYRPESPRHMPDYGPDPYMESDAYPEQEKETPAEKKKKMKGSDYAKIGVIVVLLVIILSLLFYIFNQNMGGHQNNNMQGYTKGKRPSAVPVCSVLGGNFYRDFVFLSMTRWGIGITHGPNGSVDSGGGGGLPHETDTVIPLQACYENRDSCQIPISYGQNQLVGVNQIRCNHMESRRGENQCKAG